MAINTNYNKYFQISRTAYRDGYVIGVCRSDARIGEIQDINPEVWGPVTVPHESITDVRIERCGEFNCLIVIVDIDDDDWDDGANLITLATAMEKAIAKAKHQEVMPKAYTPWCFSSEVEEKNYLQQTMVIGGKDLCKEVLHHHLNDLLTAAFYKAAEGWEWQSIPSAKEIFSIREKISSRMLRNIR